MTQNRNQLAQEIIALLCNDDVVFGGYVRDEIAGTPFNDIDIFLRSHPAKNHANDAAYEHFFQKLERKFHVKTNMWKKDWRSYVPGQQNDIQKRTLTVSVKGAPDIYVNLDVVTHPSNNPFLQLDADVNGLYLQNGQYYADSRLDLGAVRKNILNKVFEIIPGPDTLSNSNAFRTRINKLLEKGFKQKDSLQAKDRQMTTDSTDVKFLDMVKTDTGKAAYRVAAHQISKGARASLVRLLKAQGMNKKEIKSIAELLDTEVGRATICGLLGLGLPYIPGLNQDPRSQKLAHEFRVAGMTTAGNAVLDEVITAVAPSILEILGNLPALEEQFIETAKMRVATETVASNNDLAVETEHRAVEEEITNKTVKRTEKL